MTDISSINGQKLLRKGDFHVGTQINKIISMKSSGISGSYFCLACGIDGSLHAILPLTEPTYNRLYALYSKMVISLEHMCGLNPRGYRQSEFTVRPPAAAFASGNFLGVPGPRLIIDGDLIYQYISLDKQKQTELAELIGCSVNSLLDDLHAIIQTIDYF